MLKQYLSRTIYDALKCIQYKGLYELRLRANNPVVVNYYGENYYLNTDGLSKGLDNAIIVSMGDIQEILKKISNNSLYTINDQLINGFVTINGGIRVGVCGEVVSVDGNIKTLKNITSLNFRFPHFVKNCSLNLFPYIYKNNNLKSTLIVSSPGAGKTTYLRDLIYQLSSKENLLNILVVDERNEISSIFTGEETMKIKNIDVCLNSSKKFGFTNGIRSMKPDIIFTDEINLDNDIDIIESALTSGVKVIATMHASSINDIKNKSGFRELLKKSLFERYVLLSNANGIGTLEGVFDENLNFLGV